MTIDDDHGGEHLAPVIPLFGAGDPPAPTWRSTWGDDPDDGVRRASAGRSPADLVDSLADETVARPTSDPAGTARRQPSRRESSRRDSSRGRSGRAGTRSPGETDEDRDDVADRSPADPEAVERMVLRKLGARQLSVAEARTVIAGQHLDQESADALVRGLLRHGYLDDAALAEQVVRSGVEHRGQGRHVIAQTLAKRRIPREVADAAIASLPDDDEDRALEFARVKARSMARLDHEVALRRLVGQLSRRGYSSSVAMSAARTALADADGGRGR